MGRAGKSAVKGQAAGLARGAGSRKRERKSVRLAAKLKPAKRVVLDALAAGKSAAEAAELANVDAGTVSRWRNHDAAFIAALNALNLDSVKSSFADIRTLLPLASAALRKELEKGNGWLALQFIREARALGVFETGSPTAAGVKEEQKIAQQLHETELAKKQLQLQQQKHEINQLQKKLSAQNSDAKFEAMKEEGYYYAFLAFYAFWENSRKDKHVQRVAEVDQRVQALDERSRADVKAPHVFTDEQCHQIMASADRQHQADAERRRDGLSVKTAREQLEELREQSAQAEAGRAKERVMLAMKEKELDAQELALKSREADELYPSAIRADQQSSSVQAREDQPMAETQTDAQLSGIDSSAASVADDDGMTNARKAQPTADINNPDAPPTTEPSAAAADRLSDSSAKANPDIEPGQETKQPNSQREVQAGESEFESSS